MESIAVIETVEIRPAGKALIVAVKTFSASRMAETEALPDAMVTDLTPLSSVQRTLILQESTPDTVSFDGESNVITGGSLSGIVGSYLIWTESVQLLALSEESVAMNVTFAYWFWSMPITVAV